MKVTINELTQDTVSLWIEKTIEINGKTYDDGSFRRAYSNSEHGREKIKELPIEVQNSILAIWGSIPTVNVIDE